MACKYCADYIARGLKDVENFEKACEALRLDPHKQSDWEAIVRAMVMIGQFGTIRLARRFPFVTDEKTFLMVARTALNFYWMTLDFWEDKLVIERQKRKEADERRQPTCRRISMPKSKSMKTPGQRFSSSSASRGKCSRRPGLWPSYCRF